MRRYTLLFQFDGFTVVACRDFSDDGIRVAAMNADHTRAMWRELGPCLGGTRLVLSVTVQGKPVMEYVRRGWPGTVREIAEWVDQQIAQDKQRGLTPVTLQLPEIQD